MSTLESSKGEHKVEIKEADMIFYRETFGIFDKNGDGLISVDEFSSAVSTTGYQPSQEEVEAMIAAVSNSEGVTFKEFCNMMQSRSKREEDEIAELREAFDVFDENADGFVDTEDLRAVLRMCGDKDLIDTNIEDMIKQADLNEKGKVSFEDYVGMMTKPPYTF